MLSDRILTMKQRLRKFRIHQGDGRSGGSIVLGDSASHYHLGADGVKVVRIHARSRSGKVQVRLAQHLNSFTPVAVFHGRVRANAFDTGLPVVFAPIRGFCGLM